MQKRVMRGTVATIAFASLLVTAVFSFAPDARAQEAEAPAPVTAPVTVSEEPTPSAGDLLRPASEAPDATLQKPANNPLAETLAHALGKTQDTTPANPLGAAANLPMGGAASPLGMAPGYVPQTPEEVQVQMEMEADEQQKKLREEAFKKALETMLPLKPEEIRKVLETFAISREAAETPITVPKAEVYVETLNLDPGVAPPIIKMVPGHVTSLVMLDVTGAAWPIQDVSWAGKFQVVAPEDGGHVLRITPMTAHGIGNISMRMVDMLSPVTFSLASGLEESYYRFDATIPKKGPLAKVSLIENIGGNAGLSSTAGDGTLMSILDGTPPPGSSRLAVEGVDGRTVAWNANGKFYLRTPLTLLSPAWEASASSADGMNVYAMRETPVLLLSDQGKIVKAQVNDSEVSNEQ